MSRQILFRGKRKDNGKWVYGYYGEFHNRPTIDEPNSCQIFEPREDAYLAGSYIGGLWHEIDPSTVGQYTGLTDKNGKRIFEWDIVTWTSEHTRLIGHYAYDLHKGYYKGDLLQVIYNKAGFMLATLTDNMLDIPNANTKIDNYAFWNFHRQLEIIGNIHDSKEFDAQNSEEKEE